MSKYIMKRYLISICIPARRSDTLRQALFGFIKQEGFSNYCEIHICDDNSPHNLKDVYSEFKQFNNIHYHRNASNIGWLKNILHSTTFAQWEYCWIFWDDDLLKENCLSKIIVTLIEHNPDIYRCNFDWCSFDDIYNVEIRNWLEIRRSFKWIWIQG